MSGKTDQTGNPSVIPYIAVDDAARAIEFYKQAFGAVETVRLIGDDGKVSHAEIRIEGSPLMISDESPADEALSPRTIGGSPVMIVLDVEDADALFHQAIAAGASVSRPLQDSFDGALRTSKVNDPFGHRWMILTRRDPASLSGQLQQASGE